MQGYSTNKDLQAEGSMAPRGPLWALPEEMECVMLGDTDIHIWAGMEEPDLWKTLSIGAGSLDFTL